MFWRGTLCCGLAVWVAQAQPVPARLPAAPSVLVQRANDAESNRAEAEEKLRKGTALTRQGAFSEAIPYLVAARGAVADDYAASFNLALCYVATRQFRQAEKILAHLTANGHNNADVANLLAQSYVGSGQTELALEALTTAASKAPKNEKVYLFVSDACLDRHNYDLGLKVTEIGLKASPDSPRLHYQNAIFLTLLDQFDKARAGFEFVIRKAPGTEIAYLAASQENFYAGNPEGAAQAAREGVGAGFEHPTLLKIMGESLLRMGVHPPEPGFEEARKALELAGTKDPQDAGTQISLGKVYLMLDRNSDAIVHFEKAKTLDPENPAAYARLAKAYQKAGRAVEADAALSSLMRLNQEQARAIHGAPADRRIVHSDPLWSKP